MLFIIIVLVVVIVIVIMDMDNMIIKVGGCSALTDAWKMKVTSCHALILPSNGFNASIDN